MEEQMQHEMRTACARVWRVVLQDAGLWDHEDGGLAIINWPVTVTHVLN